MLPVMFKNSWFPTVFDDAVNVKEDDKAYTMELATPGIKKEYCRVNINDDGNLCIAIENKQEHKHEDKHHHYLRREFSYSNYEQNYRKGGEEDCQVHRGTLKFTLINIAKGATLSRCCSLCLI